MKKADYIAELKKAGVALTGDELLPDLKSLYEQNLSDEPQSNSLGDEPEIPQLKGDLISKSGKIEVGDPIDITPKNLPLVVKVPQSASSAQKEYARVLNSYAYKNPQKWTKKKAVLINRLESLAGHEVAESNKKLSINDSSVSFAFIRDAKGEEHYASTDMPKIDKE